MMMLSFFLACDGGTDTADSSSNTAPISLRLLSPQEGDIVCGTPLVIETEVENFTLTNENIENAPSNVGHLHVYLNGQEVVQTDQEHVDVSSVSDALYQLKVDLALSNHQALNPYVGSLVYITVDNALCTE